MKTGGFRSKDDQYAIGAFTLNPIVLGQQSRKARFKSQENSSKQCPMLVEVRSQTLLGDRKLINSSLSNYIQTSVHEKPLDSSLLTDAKHALYLAFNSEIENLKREHAQQLAMVQQEASKTILDLQFRLSQKINSAPDERTLQQLNKLQAELNHSQKSLLLEQNQHLLLQRAFFDLKQKSGNLEKVAFTYHMSLQHQKQVELDLMGQLQTARSQTNQLLAQIKQTGLETEAEMLKLKNAEKELRLKLKTSYAQAREMDQQLRQLKSKYDDVTKKLQMARKGQEQVDYLNSEPDQLQNRLESEAWQSHRLKAAIGQVHKQRQTSSGNRSNDSENMSSILRHDLQPRKTIEMTGRQLKQVQRGSMTDSKRFQSANIGGRLKNQGMETDLIIKVFKIR